MFVLNPLLRVPGTLFVEEGVFTVGKAPRGTLSTVAAAIASGIDMKSAIRGSEPVFVKYHTGLYEL